MSEKKEKTRHIPLSGGEVISIPENHYNAIKRWIKNDEETAIVFARAVCLLQVSARAKSAEETLMRSGQQVVGEVIVSMLGDES